MRKSWLRRWKIEVLEQGGVRLYRRNGVVRWVYMGTYEDAQDARTEAAMAERDSVVASVQYPTEEELKHALVKHQLRQGMQGQARRAQGVLGGLGSLPNIIPGPQP